jgi:predicted RNA-binding Zn-ribbon protein involved in translation (DUF1610 family)
MAMRDDHEVEAPGVQARRTLVYLPCPSCRKAVLIEEEARTRAEPPTYECAACGTAFVVKLR